MTKDANLKLRMTHELSWCLLEEQVTDRLANHSGHIGSGIVIIQVLICIYEQQAAVVNKLVNEVLQPVTEPA